MKDMLIVIATFGERLESKHNTFVKLLESIRSLNEKNFRILIINNTYDREYNERISGKIDRIILPFRKHFPIAQVNNSDVKKFHKFLSSIGFDELKDSVDIGNYACFRNFGLVAGILLDSPIIMFLDDDELIQDKKFLKKARDSIGKQVNGKFVAAVAGYYVNKEGNYLISWTWKALWWDIFWNKIKYMNKAFEIIGKPPRLKETNFAFGGNIVLHKDLFHRIPFDFLTQYGEDIDLLINARAYGLFFFLDKELAITHLPPPKKMSDWCVYMKKDAYRFIYERKKILEFIKEKKLPQNAIEKLDPYPGMFLRQSIYLKLVLTNLLLFLGSVFTAKFSEARTYLANIKVSLFDARHFAEKNKTKYSKVQKSWVKLVQVLDKEQTLKAEFKAKFG